MQAYAPDYAEALSYAPNNIRDTMVELDDKMRGILNAGHEADDLRCECRMKLREIAAHAKNFK